MIADLIRWWKGRFEATPPDQKEIEEINRKYEEHRQNIENIEATTKQVRQWGWRINLIARGSTGNIVRDMSAGSRRPQRKGL